MNKYKYIDGCLPKSLRDNLPSEISITKQHYINSNYEIKNVFGVDARVDKNGFVCITDIAKKKCILVNNILRSKKFQYRFYALQSEYNYPLIYVNIYTETLRGTFASSIVLHLFSDWFGDC